MSESQTIVQVSPKYQIVIPRWVREQAGITPGTRFEVEITANGLRLLQIGSLGELRGRVLRDDSLEVREKGDRT
jgi:AbrB family looped-hinge helix DNA binding protein